MNKIKNLLISSLLTLTALTLITSNQNISIASEMDKEITYDSSKHSGEVQYIKHCLKRLDYKDHKARDLYIDGIFDKKVKFALSSFLESEGYDIFNEDAKNALFEKAESTVNDDYNSGFSKDKKQLSSTIFMYSNVSNIDGKGDPFYSMGVLKNFKNVVTNGPDQMTRTSRKIMKYVNKNSNVFGYINLGPNNPYSPKSQWIQSDLNKLKVKIDIISNEGWSGIFIDQFGYDWGETRERQNIIIDYAHSKGLSVMVNAWHPQDALGSEINKRSNPQGIASHLNSNDWSLVESFYTDGTSYRGDSSYIEKYLKTKEYSEKTGVQISTLSYKRDSTSWEQAQSDVENSYILAHVLGFDGWFFAKYDNYDNLFYGKEANVDLGNVISSLKLESKNKYVAQTENYIVEYFAGQEPRLNLIAK